MSAVVYAWKWAVYLVRLAAFSAMIIAAVASFVSTWAFFIRFIFSEPSQVGSTGGLPLFQWARDAIVGNFFLFELGPYMNLVISMVSMLLTMALTDKLRRYYVLMHQAWLNLP